MAPGQVFFFFSGYGREARGRTPPRTKISLLSHYICYHPIDRSESPAKPKVKRWESGLSSPCSHGEGVNAKNITPGEGRTGINNSIFCAAFMPPPFLSQIQTDSCHWTGIPGFLPRTCYLQSL